MQPGDAASEGRVAATTEMLRRVLDGATYEAVAGDFGITRTAVERRVKGLALRLCRDVGVAGVSESGTAFVRRLRAVRPSVLDALQRYRPSTSRAPRSGRVVTEAEVAKGIARIRARSAEPWRDVALFCILFATGARPLEVARLCVGDYLAPDGSVRRRSELSAQASITGRARPLYFASRSLDEALGHYLQQRIARAQGVAARLEAYRGLDPASRLFLTSAGEAFGISRPRGACSLRAPCRPVTQTYSRLFRYAGIEGVTALSVWRTVASRLFDRGADGQQVGLVLGISERRALLARTRRDLESLVADLV